MTFIYIVKTIIKKWIKTVSKTNIAKDMLVQESQSIQTAKKLNKLSAKKTLC